MKCNQRKKKLKPIDAISRETETWTDQIAVNVSHWSQIHIPDSREGEKNKLPKFKMKEKEKGDISEKDKYVIIKLIVDVF